ncbi:MAG TPA: transporter permease [Cytophagales bacterium]|nr:transporter permease [Cytophagales bacterium]
MLQHALLMAFRGFRRQKSTFLINLIGLSLGIAAAFMIYLWVQDEYNVDQYHAQDGQLYLMKEHQVMADGIRTQSGTPPPLARTMADELPEVKASVDIGWPLEVTLTVGEENFKSTGRYVGAQIFDVFTIPLVAGSADGVMTDPTTIMLSASLARTLFESPEAAIGKTVAQGERSYNVAGVFEDLPAQSTLDFEFLLTMEEALATNAWLTDLWGSNFFGTAVVFHEGTNIEAFNEKIEMFVVEHGGEEQVRLFASKYSEEYLYSKWENGQRAGGRIEYVRLFTIVSFFIILIACINFINLSTARIARRLKEVGVKKAVGASRGALIFQFLGESLLMVFLATVIAIVLVTLLLPEFNVITGKQLSLTVTTDFVTMALTVLLGTGIISGLYPALHYSGFQPYNVLKSGTGSSLRQAWARQGLVVFQFALSVILIVSAIVVFRQIDYTQTKNLGYNKDNLVVVDLSDVGTEKMGTYLDEVRRLPGVRGAAATGHGFVEGGDRRSTSGLSWPGKDPEVTVETEIILVDEGLIELMEIEMATGRSFAHALQDTTPQVIFNQAAIDFMGMEEPLGQQVNVWGDDMEIIGVTKDFHYLSFHTPVTPQAFLLAPRYSSYAMIRIEAGQEQAVLASVESVFADLYPDGLFDYTFFDDTYQAQYEAEKRVAKLSSYFTALAILISCLGLFGLASFTAERRFKEIGIRKLLGSGEWRVVQLLSGSFLKMVLMALVIAIPVSYFFTDRWLEGFAFRIDLEWWFFVGAAILTLLITVGTIGFQLIRAARIKPIDSLRIE